MGVAVLLQDGVGRMGAVDIGVAIRAVVPVEKKSFYKNLILSWEIKEITCCTRPMSSSSCRVGRWAARSRPGRTHSTKGA